MLTRSVACARVLTHVLRKVCNFRVAEPHHLEQHWGGWSTLSCHGTCVDCGNTAVKRSALSFAEIMWKSL